MPNSLAVRGWIVGAVVALALAGCTSSVSTKLPDVETPSKSVMSAAEQERAIKDMMARKEAQQARANEDAAKAK